MTLKLIRDSIVNRIFELKIELSTLEKTLETIDSFTPSVPAVEPTPEPEILLETPKSDPVKRRMSVFDAILTVGVATNGDLIDRDELYQRARAILIDGDKVPQQQLNSRISDAKKFNLVVIDKNNLLFDVELTRNMLNREKNQRKAKPRAEKIKAKLAETDTIVDDKPQLIPSNRTVKIKTITKNDVIGVLNDTFGGLTPHEIFNTLVRGGKHPTLQAVNMHLNRLRNNGTVRRNGSGKHYLLKNDIPKQA